MVVVDGVGCFCCLLWFVCCVSVVVDSVLLVVRCWLVVCCLLCVAFLSFVVCVVLYVDSCLLVVVVCARLSSVVGRCCFVCWCLSFLVECCCR